jgi:hydrogenase maturation protein HypF
MQEPRVAFEARDLPRSEGEEAIRDAAVRLAAGGIVAVKGPGGYHLAADARDGAAVVRLRSRRQRDLEPFSVMAADPAAAREVAEVSGEEEALLLSPALPVVLLRAREPFPLAPAVAPGQRVLGVMLPPAPLHLRLLQAFARVREGSGPAVLAVTAAAAHDDPVAATDDEARERLEGLADALLLHDGPVPFRCEDSVALVLDGPRVLRRSRGFVPGPVPLPGKGPPVLGLGGDRSSSFCLTSGGEAFPGPVGGDLGNVRAAEAFVESIGRMAELLAVRPGTIVHDLDPDLRSTDIARQLADGPFRGARLQAVQHQHAHALAGLAENGFRGPALALVLDGAGFGPDGDSWGGEILAVDGLRSDRLGHLSPLRLPGGILAHREVWRIAVAAVGDLGAGGVVARLAGNWKHAHRKTLDLVRSQSRPGAELPHSTSLGRLFDAASAILGLRDIATFDGEAASAIEQEAGPLPPAGEGYPAVVEEKAGAIVMAGLPVLGGLLEDVLRGTAPSVAAARFHGAVIALLVAAARAASARSGLRTVILTGGCMGNRVLLEHLPRRLRAEGFEVLLHAAVPPGDGGLSLGRAWAGVLAGG